MNCGMLNAVDSETSASATEMFGTPIISTTVYESESNLIRTAVFVRSPYSVLLTENRDNWICTMAPELGPVNWPAISSHLDGHNLWQMGWRQEVAGDIRTNTKRNRTEREYFLCSYGVGQRA
jgi:hypothetical protein